MSKRFYLSEKVCRIFLIDDKDDLVIHNIDENSGLITLKVLKGSKNPRKTIQNEVKNDKEASNKAVKSQDWKCDDCNLTFSKEEVKDDELCPKCGWFIDKISKDEEDTIRLV